MAPLNEYADSSPLWSLTDFVDAANSLLTSYLPEDGKGQEQVNPRLVRHYTTNGLLDEPLRSGREARYEYRHLLQLLVVRRLLADGYGMNAIGDLPRSRSDTELRQLLEGGARLSIRPDNTALDYLNRIRKRRKSPEARPAVVGQAVTPPPSARPKEKPATSTAETWSRLTIRPGIELHVAEDATLPRTVKEHETLLETIRLELLRLKQRRNR